MVASEGLLRWLAADCRRDFLGVASAQCISAVFGCRETSLALGVPRRRKQLNVASTADDLVRRGCDHPFMPTMQFEGAHLREQAREGGYIDWWVVSVQRWVFDSPEKRAEMLEALSSRARSRPSKNLNAASPPPTLDYVLLGVARLTGHPKGEDWERRPRRAELDHQVWTFHRVWVDRYAFEPTMRLGKARRDYWNEQARV